jgi:hypothetical protein
MKWTDFQKSKLISYSKYVHVKYLKYSLEINVVR